MKSKQLHYISGLVLAVFIGLHLFNHLYSLSGAAKHIEIMELLRLFYRNMLVESVLLLAVVVQIVSGIKLFGKKRTTATTRFQKLHIWSGLYLAVFLVIHLGAVLAGRYVLGLDTNFYFAAAGLNTFPLSLFFIPYYGLAILAVFGHLAALHAAKMKYNVIGIAPANQAAAFLLVGFILTGFILYGMTNGLNGIAIPAAYDVLIGK